MYTKPVKSVLARWLATQARDILHYPLVCRTKCSDKMSFDQTRRPHQCTRAVCSTFAEIHCTVTPRCIDALFGVRMPFQSLAESPKGNPDSSPPVQSPVMFTQVTVGHLYYDSRNLPVKHNAGLWIGGLESGLPSRLWTWLWNWILTPNSASIESMHRGG